jgi:hypothetical protein
MKKKLQQAGLLTNPTYLQIIYPHVEWLLSQREVNTDRNHKIGINSGVILFSAIYLEGFLEDILCTFLPTYSNSTSDGKSEAMTKIEELSSLPKYKDAFEGFGIPINSLLKVKDLEDVDAIFKFRNLLAHGQRESYLLLREEGDFTTKQVSKNSFTELESFFVKRKILKKSQYIQPNIEGQLFSDSVADWFSKTSLDLSLKILKELKLKLEYRNISQIHKINTLHEFFFKSKLDNNGNLKPLSISR